MRCKRIERSLQLYLDDDVLAACQTVFSNYGDPLENIDQKDSFSRLWLNYLSSMCFEIFGLGTCPNLALQQAIEEDTRLLVDWGDLLPRLQFDERIMKVGQACPRDFEENRILRNHFPETAWLDSVMNCEHHHILFPEEEGESFEAAISDPYRATCINLFRFVQSQLLFFQNHISFGEVVCFWNMLSAFVDNYRPFYPFQFKRENANDELQVSLKEKSSKQLVYFMEAVEGIDWKSFFSTLQDRQAIFLFPNLNTFIRCIFEKEFSSCCLKPTVRSLILNKGLLEQWNVQEGEWKDFTEFHWVFLEKSTIWKQYQKPFQDNLKARFSSQSFLNTLGKRLNLKWKARHLEGRRGLSFYRDCFYQTLYDSNMHLEMQNIKKEDSPLYIESSVMNDFESKRQVRSLDKKSMYRIAHLVKTFSDLKSHAPTKRLLSLLGGYNEDKFEVHLLSVEQNILRLEDYPSVYYQHSSLLVGSRVIEQLRESGKEVYIDYHSKSQEDSAEKIVEELKLREIDLAIFHEVSPMHLMIAAQCDVPVRLFFEHGAVPNVLPFEGVILSHEEEVEYWKKKFPSWKGKWLANDKGHFHNKQEEFSHDILGIGKEHLVLMTVCTRLNERFSNEFCSCVAEILRAVPEAIFFAIGDGDFALKKGLFEKEHVESRVRYLGYKNNPTDYLALADVYLNEFPVGGSSSVCEAISMGCPVVSRYYRDSDLIAMRSGSYFMGEVPYIETAADYIQTAIRLLSDDKLRKEWQVKARKRTLYINSVERYAKSHQELILDTFSL